ncbi:hypothetical protein ACQP3F_33625, partial [Escherichia coli]
EMVAFSASSQYSLVLTTLPTALATDKKKAILNLNYLTLPAWSGVWLSRSSFSWLKQGVC